MNDNTRRDLHGIFGNSLTDSLFTRLIEHLDQAVQIHPDSITVKTRNDKNQILKFQGITYFSLVYTLREKPVITAGAVEKEPKKGRVPVMRFRDTNSALRSISSDYKFPYKKPNWTNVEIRSETIELFPALLRTEVNDFFSKFGSSWSGSSKEREYPTKNKSFFSVTDWIIGTAVTVPLAIGGILIIYENPEGGLITLLGMAMAVLGSFGFVLMVIISIDHFFSQANSPESTGVIQSPQERPPLSPLHAYNRNRTSVASPLLVLMIALGITAILLALLNLPRASESTQQPIPPSIEQSTIPKPNQPDPPKPTLIEKRFTFTAQGGMTVTAHATSDTKYGSDRYLVLFTPFLNKTDGNFYLGALAALHQLYGKHRGLFQLNDATRVYDPVISAYAYYWIISNPSQKYYCLPVIDSETQRIASIVVWVQ
jgi:hypothetical protein